LNHPHIQKNGCPTAACLNLGGMSQSLFVMIVIWAGRGGVFSCSTPPLALLLKWMGLQ